MDKNRAIELFEKAKGITRPSQKINAYKQKYGWLVLRESIQYNVTSLTQAAGPRVVNNWLTSFGN